MIVGPRRRKEKNRSQQGPLILFAALWSGKDTTTYIRRWRAVVFRDKVHYFDLLWIYCRPTTSCTTNPHAYKKSTANRSWHNGVSLL